MSRFGKIEEVVLGEKPHNKPNWPFPHGYYGTVGASYESFIFISGFAFVQFSTRKEADKAVAASSSSQGLKVRGRQVVTQRGLSNGKVYRVGAPTVALSFADWTLNAGEGKIAYLPAFEVKTGPSSSYSQP